MTKITQQGAVTTIVYDVYGGSFERWVLLMSDNHHDSILCNRELEKRHLDEAKRRKAHIMILGDLFDGMQGRYDPRRSMNEVRTEYKADNYYDLIERDTFRFLAPYAKHIAVISDGNHELAILKNANTNLPDRLVGDLRLAGSGVVHGGYGGWVRFMFERKGTPQCSLKLKYFHGAGGEAPVTRGVIQTNRQAVYLPDADIVVNGHNHNAYIIPICRERINNKGNLSYDIQWHVRTPGYKQSYGDGTSGWDVTRGGVPKPLGAMWLHFTFNGNTSRANLQVIPELDNALPINTTAPEMYTGVVYAQDSEYP